MRDIAEILAKEFDLKRDDVRNTISLIENGNTIPFIARYRKEMTGGMNDQVLADLHDRFDHLRNLEKRKEDIKTAISEQGKLDADLAEAIDRADSFQEIEDIYRPFRQKRKTRASAAREKDWDLWPISYLCRKIAV